MDAHKVPILLSYYAMSNGNTLLTFGQLTYTRIGDLSFKDYSRRKTFRTLFRLYHTRPYANQQLALVFDNVQVKVTTNTHGAFYVKVQPEVQPSALKKVTLATGEEVKLVDGLYDLTTHYIHDNTIVVSDIDDTLMHSFIFRKLRKFRTLMFTTVERRKTVVNMQELMENFVGKGATPVYLSNSEQNLYPMIYRFLFHNKFPRGPLFLKQMRSLWDVVRNIKFPLKNVHKTSTLEELLSFFPDKKFILMGDNTQHDLPIYLSIAAKYPQHIRKIIIRKVVENIHDETLIHETAEKLRAHDIEFHYADALPMTARET